MDNSASPDIIRAESCEDRLYPNTLRIICQGYYGDYSINRKISNLLPKLELPYT